MRHIFTFGAHPDGVLVPESPPDDRGAEGSPPDDQPQSEQRGDKPWAQGHQHGGDEEGYDDHDGQYDDHDGQYDDHEGRYADDEHDYDEDREGSEAQTEEHSQSRVSVVDEQPPRPAPPEGASEEEYRFHTYK